MRFSPFRKKQLEVYKTKRFMLIQVAFVGLASIVFMRAVHLHIFEGDFLKGEGQKRFLRQEKLAAYRGMILDRNGKALAVSTPTLSLWANPKQFKQASPSHWQLLSDSLGKPLSQLKQQFHHYRNKEFMFLKRQMPPEDCQKILDLKIPGLYATTEYRRFYPAGDVVSHLVGFADIDEEGQEGIELAYNKHLKGKHGNKLVVKDLLNHTVKDLGIRTPAMDGENLWLSIDLRIQYRAYQALEQAVIQHKAQAASLIAMDIQSGEVLAMANYPSYNPNDRKNLNPKHLRNRAITDLFEPGSTIKPFTVAAGLESGLFSSQTEFDTSPGYMRVGRKTIRDHRNYGTIDLSTILTKSSNVGATQIALSLPSDSLPNILSRFGFGQYLGSGFPGESLGYLPGEDLSRPIEIATLSYGYGMSTTLLHLAQAYATIGRYGLHRPLSLIAKTSANAQQHGVKKRGSKSSFTPIAAHDEQIIDSHIAQQLLLMMETVVSREGTAAKAGVKGYRIAGKTGTTHKLSNGKYEAGSYLSLFGGIAPVSEPRWVAVVVVDDPKNKAYYGGEVAAPVFKEVINALFRLNGTPPDQFLYEVGQLDGQAHQASQDSTH